MILVLVRGKVEKNDMFFPHVSLRAEGQKCLNASGVMVMRTTKE